MSGLVSAVQNRTAGQDQVAPELGQMAKQAQEASTLNSQWDSLATDAQRLVVDSQSGGTNTQQDLGAFQADCNAIPQSTVDAVNG